MKTLLAVILLIGFIALAVFGFIEITSSTMPNGETHRGCLASAVQNTDCPNKIGDFGSAFFHIAAFKFFSTSTLETLTGLVVLLTLIWLVAAVLIRILGSRLVPLTISDFQLPTRRRPDFDGQTSYLSSLLLSWLALKELSPTR